MTNNETAYHEAAHAVACIVVGVPFFAIALRAGQGQHAGVAMLTDPRSQAPPPLSANHDAADTLPVVERAAWHRRHLIIAWAGWCADIYRDEQISTAPCPEVITTAAASDMKIVQAYARCVTTDEAAAQALIAETRQEGTDLVRDPLRWSAICRIADALAALDIGYQVLFDWEVRRIYQETQRGWFTQERAA